jgi:dephospho-CoA kinase
MSRVLGFVGWPCAGKDEGAEYLERRHHALRFGHSNFIREIAREQGDTSVVPTEVLSLLFEARAAHAGYGWIARLVSERVQRMRETDPQRPVVITGVRNHDEVTVYRELPGFQLVKLETSFEIRYQRWCQRRRSGEQDTSCDALLAIERLPGNANVGEIMDLPGPTIRNEGTKQDFYAALDRLI